MSWNKKIQHPSKVAKVGDEVDVVSWTSSRATGAFPWASSKRRRILAVNCRKIPWA